jgi:DNA processing protein
MKRAGESADAELDRAEAAGIRAICLEDEAYPAMLKTISDAPPVLWVRGRLEPRDLNALAIVGSRRCSHYGREQADRFGSLVAQAGLTIVSGGARGVDSAAHRGAMALPNGRTIAVLGCGVDIAYPPENAGLFAEIAKRGAVVSEFALGTPPAKENFPRRNRIISGMSRGVLVVEADVASGALITARLACDSHNRPVFAIPGKIDNPMSAGPHALIRDGAVLVTGLEDVLGNLGPVPHELNVSIEAQQPQTPSQAVRGTTETGEKRRSQSVIELDGHQQKIVDGIDSDPTHLDTIITRTELPAEVVMRELTMLSLRGVVKRVDGQSYVRT